MVYPITAHSMTHQHDEDGGFVIEATTIQDPIAFATTLRDESGPFWGQRLVDAVRGFRYWNGVLAMVSDENNASVVARRGRQRGLPRRLPSRSSTSGSTRRSTSAARVLERAGAKQVAWTGIASTHVQGSCRMGDDPARSAVDRNGESHEVQRPVRRRRLARPAHALGQPLAHDHGARDRLAEHLDADAAGYLGAARARMKAALLAAYHRPLELVERPEPEPVRPRDVVVRVGGAGVCATDLHAMRA